MKNLWELEHETIKEMTFLCFWRFCVKAEEIIVNKQDVELRSHRSWC
jgi:hypothetical protein